MTTAPVVRELAVDVGDVEGLSGAATCEALGIGEAAMKTRLHRAREMLREHVQARLDRP